MLVKVKGWALVEACWEEECECCGQITWKEQEKVIHVDEIVDAYSTNEADSFLEQGEKITKESVINEFRDDERVYFKGWDTEPEIRALEMDEIMRRVGAPALF